jgi:hypothetical protein
MKKLYILIFVIIIKSFFCYSLLAQEPFDVPTIDDSTFKTIDYSKGEGKPLDFSKAFIDSIPTSTIKGFRNNIKSFSKINFGITTTDGSIVPNLNVNIVQYRLCLFSWIASKNSDSKTRYYKKGDTIRFYLPFLLISKFNTNYDSTNIATISDMTSFMGSPLTLRFMPSYVFNIGLENTLTIGHSSDLRTIFYKDSTSQVLKTDFGYYGTLGIKYSGRGNVRANDGQSFNGTWSMSGLIYIFKTNKNIQKQLFENQNNLSSGFEVIFKFKVLETQVTQFNIYASMQYQFNKPKNLNPYMFKINIGN